VLTAYIIYETTWRSISEGSHIHRNEPSGYINDELNKELGFLNEIFIWSPCCVNFINRMIKYSLDFVECRNLFTRVTSCAICKYSVVFLP
jgi:hypothetical protein